MNNFVAKPYKLYNKIQNYEWGTRNNEAFIPKFLGICPEVDTAYAELWIGAHPKAPSTLNYNNENISLDRLIKNFPEEILGKKTYEKFNGKLPFLLKILSARKALSIQTHPNKTEAEELHRKDPVNYPDNNHKPEVAVAIDYLNAIVGFKPVEEIKKIFLEFTEIRNITGDVLFDMFNKTPSPESLKKIYVKILECNKEEIEPVLLSIKKKIKNKDLQFNYEKQFLNEFKEYGTDAGLFSILMFNYIKLKADQGIFTNAGVPHAYLRGNIIECMANSDNVVRAGLTPKYKDVKTLSKILDYSTEKPEVLGSKNNNVIKYNTPAKEFELSIISVDDRAEETIKQNSVIIYLITEGRLKILVNNKDYNFSKGETIMLPAAIKRFSLIIEAGSKIVKVVIPE